jgi:structural maintenance of chromosome 3 (chondroitin sulfate proteoglycan 6)
MTHALGQMQMLEARRKQALDIRARYAAEASWTQKELEQSTSRVANFERELEEAEAELRKAEAKRTSHEEELKTPMSQQLTEAEIKDLESLTKDTEDRKATLFAVNRARQKVGR